MSRPQGLKPMSDAEESRLMEVLNTIADKVVKDRIMMYQYFKDYDRVNINISEIMIYE